MNSGRCYPVVRAGTAVAVAGCAVALYNRVTMPRLAASAAVVEPVTVCVPARDEAGRLPALLADLRVQTGVPDLRVLILDDASTDGTAAAAAAVIAGDDRFLVIRSEDEPDPGWTGKAAACQRLGELADTAALVFLDADVRLGPGAIAAAVHELRRREVALVAPWPAQVAGSAAEALVQPLLCWSWAAALPITAGNRSRRPSTAVACGQFLVFDTAAYRAIGGHRAVAASPTEDLDIARALRRSGRHTAVVAAGRLASTRMYSGAAELDAGYTRWLWSAYGGSRVAAAAVGAVAALAYWIPPLAAATGRGSVRRAGLLGYSAAVAGRLLTRTTETAAAPTRTDIVAALSHPAAVAAYAALTVRSHRAHRRGTLRWKQRALRAG
ncbi:glycosyltransferase family 2 protein [Nocardia sp. NPDC050712]|uniref:glycosyltransferase n=1 Tax=Nocardia sp. NPDC050712 TaxID=3155518 RepID=UPI0033F6C411